MILWQKLFVQNFAKKNIRKVKVLCSREKAYRERRIGKQKESHEHMLSGSISFIPGAAGMLIAGEVVKDLLTEKIKRKIEDTICE